VAEERARLGRAVTLVIAATAVVREGKRRGGVYAIFGYWEAAGFPPREGTKLVRRREEALPMCLSSVGGQQPIVLVDLFSIKSEQGRVSGSRFCLW
jgi:hypothetical protein